MVNFCAVCGYCTRTDIVREHLEDTLRIGDVSAMGLFRSGSVLLQEEPQYPEKTFFCRGLSILLAYDCAKIMFRQQHMTRINLQT
jgi:hypothetical protein